MEIMIDERTVAKRRARDQQIAERGDHRRRRRPFLDRKAQARSPGSSASARRTDEEHRARHDRHVQAGDRQDVQQPEVAEGVVGRLRDAAALAGDQRVGDGAALARQRRGDARADRLAQALDDGPSRRSSGALAGIRVDATGADSE